MTPGDAVARRRNGPGRGSRRPAAAGVATLALVLQGCVGSLLESDAVAPESYRLGRASAAMATAEATSPPAASPASLLALVVARPRAPTSLDTNRIAVAPGGHRFDHYSGVQWAEPAPQMLQQLLVAALGASGHYAGVFAAPARAPAELLLDVELRHFEAVADGSDGAPVVHVQMQASLVDARRAMRVSSFSAEARVAASGNRRAPIIAAFERASAQVVDDVVRQVATAAAQVPANPDQD